MALAVSQIITSIFCTAAVPLHIIVTATYIKFKKTQFKDAFFTLAISLLINDTLKCIVFPFYTAIGFDKPPPIIKNGTEIYINWMGMVHSTFMATFATGNLTGIGLIAFNRFCFFAIPYHANRIWSKKRTLAFIFCQWIVSVAIGIGHKPHMIIKPGITRPVPDTEAMALWSTIFAITNAACCILVMTLYVSTFGAIVSHRVTMSQIGGYHVSPNEAQHNTLEIKLAFQGCFVSIFALPGIFRPAAVPILFSRVDLVSMRFYMNVFDSFITVNYYSTSFILLVTSKKLRTHVKKLFGISPTAVAPEAIQMQQLQPTMPVPVVN